ncbi:ROK family protein [Streptomyces sp. 891-h]|uniref:ROK family protein n=1 Tax=Streptomyces sp. 891-h TaxID=2720714 RepID=UPI001FAA4B37|nr:ROK family protein [Streptomyces sp. 891-h]UNZ16542.1 ROK family protein [Streptomyces sp. 891-h]
MTGTTGNQSSAGHLLQLIRDGRATTRGALQRVTGLSRSTVGHRLDQLFAAGWLREGEAAPAPGSTGGRPSARLEFDAGHAVVLAADLGTRHATAGVLDLAGNVLAERSGRMLIGDGPELVLDRLGQWFAELLKEHGTDPARVCGIGLSVPGPVDVGSGTVVQPPIMPGWDGYPLRARMRDAYAAHVTGAAPVSASPASSLSSAIPVFVDNDANLMAYAEQRAGYPDCAAFLLVKVATGIGAGVVVDGRPYRGVDGGAGDIGHIRLADCPDALCMCGNHGCLAAVAGGRALADQLSAVGGPAASSSGSGSDVRDQLAAGRPEAVRLAREAGRRVGEVLVTVVTLLNPGVLMIAGDLAGTPFLTGVRELLYQRALPRTTAHLDVVTSRLGERAGLIGAALMVVDELYAPTRADARLTGTAPIG